jgi:hypothetical protein
MLHEHPKLVSGVPAVLALLVTVIACRHGGWWWLARDEHRRDRTLWPVAAAIGLALLTLQISGGAFQAEFMGHSDEAAQFVSGLMVYDYLATLPRENPIAWAGQYYLHYPKVAIGHWPPGYPVLEAAWWLIVGPSRTTAMLLQWLIGVAALTMLYRLCRSWFSPPIALAIVGLTMAAPVFQQNLEQAMADLCCLLWSVLLMTATVRLVEKQDRTAIFQVVLWLVAAALTKGTVVCLAPVPLVALLASRQPIRLPSRMLWAGTGCLLAAAAWYLYMGGVRAWGGIYFDVPWPGALIGRLAGWGFLGLAVFGLGRKPLALVAGSVILCTLSVSFVVRAMQEDRHWIIALPAILILSGFAVTSFGGRWAAICLLLPALALFPFARYHQAPSEMGDLVRQLARPSRMLVSSAGWGEGAWIAVSSLAERRPGSIIMRATKVLAETGWNGEGYHLIAQTQDAVARRLDELAVDTVILHSPFNPNPRPHHVLLRNTLNANSNWRPCGSARDLLAYCRIGVPRVPRQPLRMRVYGWDFQEQISLLFGEPIARR